MGIKKIISFIIGTFILYPLAFVIDINNYIYDEIEYLQDKLDGRFT